MVILRKPKISLTLTIVHLYGNELIAHVERIHFSPKVLNAKKMIPKTQRGLAQSSCGASPAVTPQRKVGRLVRSSDMQKFAL